MMFWMDQELFQAAAGEEYNLPEVRRLLSVGADIEATNRHGATPLHMACWRGHAQVVKVLRDHGADTEVQDYNIRRTPLHFACVRGHLAVVNELLSPNDSNATTTTTIGKRKSREGANTEAKDNDSDTPLHYASAIGHLEIVKALGSGGADILAVDKYGELPIHCAVRLRKSEVVKYLLQQFYATIRRLPLHKLLEDLTWTGNPNITSRVPPLHDALHQDVLGTGDAVEIIEYLVDQNPEFLSSRDHDGSLPLHVACRRGVSFPIVQSLVHLYKASVKSLTSEGDLPLFLACEMPESSMDTIFLLVKLYPDVIYQCDLPMKSRESMRG
jgi:ankyrin repeat protein